MQITLTFNAALNISLSIGDTIWYTSTTSAGGYDVSDIGSILNLGKVEEIMQNQNKIKVSRLHDPANFVPPTLPPNNYVMFSKPNSFNTSGLKGYYAEVRLDNNSTEKVELFAVSSEISESSK